MSIVIPKDGPLYGFGDYEKSKLPEGWKFIERHNHWLLATDPNGREYFVAMNRVIPVIHKEDGEEWADYENPIML